jgi:hypothetical protein
LKRKLGITLNSTKGLLNERQFRRFSGISRVGKYRKKDLIVPTGYALTSSGVSPFYRPRQAKDLKRNLGVTLSTTKGLLNEKQFIKASELSSVAEYRKRGLIKPVGYALTTGVGASPYYKRRQIEELRKVLGITLRSTKGLLSEKEFREVSGFTNIAAYRKKSIIKPVGYALSGPHIGAYYNKSQIKKLRAKLRNKR